MVVTAVFIFTMVTLYGAWLGSLQDTITEPLPWVALKGFGIIFDFSISPILPHWSQIFSDISTSPMRDRYLPDL